MATVSVYRALLIVRACWLLIGWFFGWGLSEHSRSFASIHPYAALFGQAFGVAFGLIILAGLWFFRRWARLLFVVLLVAAVLYGAFQVHEPRVMPPVFLAPVIW